MYEPHACEHTSFDTSVIKLGRTTHVRTNHPTNPTISTQHILEQEAGALRMNVNTCETTYIANTCALASIHLGGTFGSFLTSPELGVLGGGRGRVGNDWAQTLGDV